MVKVYSHLIRQFVKVAIACSLMYSSWSEWTSQIRQLLLAVTQVIDVDDRHFIERQHGPLLHPTEDNSIQLRVVVQQRAVDLQTQ